MSGLGGGAASPGPVVAEVVEPGVGSAGGEAIRELFEACRSGVKIIQINKYEKVKFFLLLTRHVKYL